jgi:hypothetical protein
MKKRKGKEKKYICMSSCRHIYDDRMKRRISHILTPVLGKTLTEESEKKYPVNRTMSYIKATDSIEISSIHIWRRTQHNILLRIYHLFIFCNIKNNC